MFRILFKPWKSELIQKLRCQLSVPHFSLQCANMGRSLNLPKTSHLLPRTSGNEEYTFYLVYKTFLMSKRQNFGLLKTFFENMHFDSDRHFDSGIPVLVKQSIIIIQAINTQFKNCRVITKIPCLQANWAPSIENYFEYHLKFNL